MAFQMSYTAADGGEHPQSYWRVVSTQLDRLSRTGIIAFYGWHNAAYRANKKPTIGQVEYAVPVELYNQFFDAAIVSTADSNDEKQSYLLARAVPVPPANYFEADQQNGVPNMFFATAIDV